MAAIRSRKDSYFTLRAAKHNPDREFEWFGRRGEFAPNQDIDFEMKHLPRIEYLKKKYANENGRKELLILTEEKLWYR